VWPQHLRSKAVRLQRPKVARLLAASQAALPMTLVGSLGRRGYVAVSTWDPCQTRSCLNWTSGLASGSGADSHAQTIGHLLLVVALVGRWVVASSRVAPLQVVPLDRLTMLSQLFRLAHQKIRSKKVCSLHHHHHYLANLTHSICRCHPSSNRCPDCRAARVEGEESLQEEGPRHSLDLKTQHVPLHPRSSTGHAQLPFGGH